MFSPQTTSVRIVSVDHYMSKPDARYDVCYSQFRGTEVKQVPVIRLFGTTVDGTHSCVHIHGVFPYFYIPYEGSTADQLTVDQRIYQLASALDRAINVSLSRSSSRAMHIFKIVLVKGVPIYGYHRNAHNYLKIYMYNPMLVRTATTLLMNGAIPSAVPQVHETHIPYILQFFIDYNLYGMSFLHLNATGLRERTNSVTEGNSEVPPKMSTSEYEIDALASDIMNREPDESDDGEFANPGIASIWKDEETRRRLYGLEQPEKANLSQDDDSSKEIITESDRFYRAMLASKLLKESESTATVEHPPISDRKNAYPSEADEGTGMLDASYIADHVRTPRGHSNNSLYASQISYHFDASTEIDEEKIMIMTQNSEASMREEDYNLLEIMRELEEKEKHNFEGDCLLAPLTQQSEGNNRPLVSGYSIGGLNPSQSNKRLNASMCGDLEALCLMKELENDGTKATSEGSLDSDDEFLLDLTQKQLTTRREDSLERSLHSGDEELLSGGCIPQLDGADEPIGLRSAKRNRKSNETTADTSSSAKRIRKDSTKLSLTPRKLALGPITSEGKNHDRSESIRKDFEASSPNTLKKFEIRVPKLSHAKKSVLVQRNSSIGEKRQGATLLQDVRVRLTRLDPESHPLPKEETNKSPAATIADRYRLSYEYDITNNYDPIEGPSTPKPNRIRKTNLAKISKGPSMAKRMKQEEQQEIEVVLSERFKNIIRLSPKVLIKPLSMMGKDAFDCTLLQTKSAPPMEGGKEKTPTVSTSEDISAEMAAEIAMEEKGGKHSSVASTEEMPMVTAPAEESVEMEAAPRVAIAASEDQLLTEASKEENEKTPAAPEGDQTERITSAVISEASALPISNDEQLLNAVETETVEDNDETEAETNAATEIETDLQKANKPETMGVMEIFDSDSDEAVPNSGSSIPPNQPVFNIESNSGDESMSEPVVLRVDSPESAMAVSEMIINDPETLLTAPPPEKQAKENIDTISSVPIGSQLDGVVELMEEGNGDEPELLSEAEEDDQGCSKIQSFCETTMLCDVDDIGSDSDEGSPGATSRNFAAEEEDNIPVRIRIVARPPTREQAQQAIESFEIPATVNATPFYSNPADVTGKKEVGHTVLHITGNSLNDLEVFKSGIGGLRSMKHFRYEILKQTYGESIDEVLGPVGANGPNADRMKELLASERSVIIKPSMAPPSHAEADAWLAERFRNPPTERASNNNGDTVGRQDSPTKVKKAEAIMTIDEEASTEPIASTQPQIDSESSLNLSVLLTSEDCKPTSTRGSTKNLVSQIMTMNTYSPNSDSVAPVGYSARKKKQKLFGKPSSKNPNTETASGASVDPKSTSSDELAQQAAVDVIDSSQMPEKLAEPLDEERNAADRTDKNATPSPCTVTLSNQSDVTEQSNANISMATPHGDNTYGFKVDYENLQQAKPGCEHNYLTVLAVEVHVQTRGDLRPNPSADPIAAIFYRIHNDVPSDHPRASSVCGIILNRELLCEADSEERLGRKYNQSPYVADVVQVAGERELYEKFLLLIAFWDPDIFTGYEIECLSWGYIIERGYVLEMNLMKMLSRIPTAEKVHVSEEEQQELLEMHDYSAGLKIPGRILLDIWRLMRHEIALTSYTFENVAYHILHRRVPCHSHRQLSRLWNKSYSRWIVLDYYLERVNGNFEILNQLDLIGRTAELAKLFGIQFYEVLSRGSQFRVESMMLRIAKPRNFVSVSPTIQQRAHMRAPEYLPLIMEPNSRFYADPIIVLDFQSLYPSVIIAYNYCFSTCLGRIEHLAQSTEAFEFGASHLRIPPNMLRALMEKNLVTCSPCGIAFVKKRVREGVLPRMLSEILNTRLMVKKSMKLHKGNSVLQRVLHSRQLGLKLIANVTYGYTAANFSGRMPCVEIGDSVVAKGRETLERAIKLVEGTERWGAKVVYGDTDSLFVLCPGRTKAEAFKIGAEIVESVTKENPAPVKLKLEKVYQPSILQTKKRYVGYMYETPDQEKPTYEAKGIETVRRDGCPVVAKMLEKVLRILFETCDVSQVKQYTCRQFTKILEGRVNLQDFIFAKEFRGEEGYKPGACVPALELSRKWKLTDPRRVPRRGERVPYVIINGPPLVPLIRLVRSPDEVLSNEGLKINAHYYIAKAIIPPLNRCLLLIGADVHQWYNDLPRKMLMLHNTAGATSGGAGRLMLAKDDQPAVKKSTISQYFSTTNCIVDCGRQTQHGICKTCQRQPQYALLHIMNKMNKLERKLEYTEKMCRSCCQRGFETSCVSLDCPVMFSLNRRMVEQKQTLYYRELLEQFF